MSPQYTTIGGYPHSDPYYISPEEEAEMYESIIADSRNASGFDKHCAFSLINGLPIFWNCDGLRHSVQGADVHPGVRLLWTRCEIDVPTGAAFVSGWDTEISCPACVARTAAPVVAGAEQMRGIKRASPSSSVSPVGEEGKCFREGAKDHGCSRTKEG